MAASDSDVGFESVSDDGSDGSDSDGGGMHATANARSGEGNPRNFVSLLDKATATVKSRMKEGGGGGGGDGVARVPGSGARRLPNSLPSRKRKKPVDGEDGAAAKKKKKITKHDPVNKSAVIYIGHVPHGFYEDQMRAYFSQFGDVRRLRLSRNKKTGRSKHYAFIEFEKRTTAKIVAATMQGYFLAGRQLVSHVVKASSVHPKMFAGSNRKFRPIPWRLIAKQKHNAPRTEAQQAQRVKNLHSKEAKKREKLKALGIEYDFVGYAGKSVEVVEAAVEGDEEEAAAPKKKSSGESSAKKKKKKKKTKSR